MAELDWRDAERSFARPGAELARLGRRWRRRAIASVVAAAAIAALLVGALALRAASHEAYVVLRVSEGIISDGQGMPRGELRGYVESALLTRPVLLDLIEAEGLFEAERERGEQFAIEALRRSLSIEIYGNFFASWERIGPRSLRIRITYRSGDRDEAAGVARRLAGMIESAEIHQRQWRFEESSELSQSVVARAEQRLEVRRRQLTDQLVELRRAELDGDAIHAGTLRLQANHLASIMQFEDRTLRAALLEQGELEFRRAAARERLGILFTVVDERLPPPPRFTTWAPLLAVGGIVFVLTLPLAGIAAGAFDPRLHERGDIARLGLPVIGHVSRFQGRRRGPRGRLSGARRRAGSSSRP
jgi:hypothetical protein